MDISVNFYNFIEYFSFSKKSKLKKVYKRKQKGNDDIFLSIKTEKQKENKCYFRKDIKIWIRKFK